MRVHIQNMDQEYPLTLTLSPTDSIRLDPGQRVEVKILGDEVPSILQEQKDRGNIDFHVVSSSNEGSDPPTSTPSKSRGTRTPAGKPQTSSNE